MRRLLWLARWHNIKIAPVVLFIRAPIMLVAMTMHAVGKAVSEFADEHLPAFTEYPK